jgi:hypothetical protein
MATYLLKKGDRLIINEPDRKYINQHVFTFEGLEQVRMGFESGNSRPDYERIELNISDYTLTTITSVGIRVCPTCKGAGVDLQTVRNMGSGVAAATVCWRCHGTGTVGITDDDD